MKGKKELWRNENGVISPKGSAGIRSSKRKIKARFLANKKLSNWEETIATGLSKYSSTQLIPNKMEKRIQRCSMKRTKWRRTFKKCWEPYNFNEVTRNYISTAKLYSCGTDKRSLKDFGSKFWFWCFFRLFLITCKEMEVSRQKKRTNYDEKICKLWKFGHTAYNRLSKIYEQFPRCC